MALVRCVLLMLMVLRTIKSERDCTRAPCVKTKQGRVIGREVETILANGELRRVNVFLGIPFAKPPTGTLRFVDPRPVDRWNGLRRATSFGKSCFGRIDKSNPGFLPAEMWNPPGNEAALSEDCLYLNVWTPSRNRGRVPVLVWIYGGGFYSGSSSLWMYNGQFLSAAENVVVVTINYRLAALGFMMTRDGKISGNFGLKDQQMALRWVQENIEYFGGDKTKVTIMGESAGASSVGYHLLSKGSHALFKRAMMNSASPLSPWGYRSAGEVMNNTGKLLEKLLCSRAEDVMKCLRSLSPWAIYEKDTFSWYGTVDGAFLTDTPLNLLSKGDFKRADMIFSINRNEGAVRSIYELGDHFTRSRDLQPITMAHFKADVKELFPKAPTNDINDVVSIFSEGIESNGTGLSEALGTVIGDGDFICPLLRWADEMSRRDVPVYTFQLNYRSSTEGWPGWTGVIHGADCQWTFGIPLDRARNYRQSEIVLAEKYMKYLGNFARSGNPNGGRLPHWPRYDGKKTLCYQHNMTIETCEVPSRPRRTCWKLNAINGISGSGTTRADWTFHSVLTTITLLLIRYWSN